MNEQVTIRYGRGGKTAVMLDAFRYSLHQETLIPYLDEEHAVSQLFRFASLPWCKAEIHKTTELGRPTTLIIDELGDNPQIITRPNEQVNWWIKLTKNKNQQGVAK